MVVHRRLTLTHWFYAIYLQTTTRNGVAAKELERQLNICYKTALRMAHQIKKLMSNNVYEPFSGVVAADEVFIGGLNGNRHKDKRYKNSQGRSNVDKTPVFVMINLSGKVKAYVVDNTSSEILLPIIANNVQKENCILVTDEHKGYTPLERNQYMHVTVCHGMGEYGRGAWHTNTPESFNACLKRTIKGTHIHVSKRHLQKYVDEVAFRWMHKDQQDQMFEIILRRVI
jgi:transposase-like protein